MKKPENTPLKPGLRICLLGKFRVCLGGRELTGARARSSLMWKLFKYLIISRPRAASTDKLIDVLWPDGECDDPLRALYTLMYRLRGVLGGDSGVRRDFILFSDNSYCWNEDESFTVDLDDFIECCRAAKELPDEQAAPELEAALKLYAGDLLADSPEELWMLPSSNLARRLYIEAAARLAGVYLSLEQYESAARACESALEIDGYDEDLHLSLLKALMGLGRMSMALAHYEYYAAMLYNEFGVTPSARFTDFYEKLRGSSPELRLTVGEIMRDLDRSDANDTGPIYCDMDTFTKIYHLERRIIERTGQSIYLVCLRFRVADGCEVSPGEYSELTSLLKRMAIFGLRRSDALTQLSESQLLMLLMNISYENCGAVMKRFEDRFFANYHGVAITISHEFKPLRAFAEEEP